MKLIGHVHKSEVRHGASTGQPYISWEVIDEDTHQRVYLTLFEGNMSVDDPALGNIAGARVSVIVQPAAPYTSKDGKSYSQVAVVPYTRPSIF